MSSTRRTSLVLKTLQDVAGKIAAKMLKLYKNLQIIRNMFEIATNIHKNAINIYKK